MVRYNSSDGILEIIIRNEVGKKEEHMKINIHDKKAWARVLRKIKEKYGLDFRDEGLFDF